MLTKDGTFGTSKSRLRRPALRHSNEHALHSESPRRQLLAASHLLVLVPRVKTVAIPDK